MKTKHYNVLIVEAYPLMTSSYKDLFQKMEANGKLSFTVQDATDFEAALHELDQFNPHTRPLDLLLLDLQLNPVPELKLYGGQDFAPVAKKKFPQLKIMITTIFSNPYLTSAIFKEINPDGFIVKSELTSSLFIESIREVLRHRPFYSPSLMKLLRQPASNTYVLDKIDRQLLYEISTGAILRDIVQVLPLSLSGIEKRKRHLKEIFQAHNDHELLETAKKLGFL